MGSTLGYAGDRGRNGLSGKLDMQLFFRGLFNGGLVLLVPDDIAQRPLDAGLEGVFAHAAVFLPADTAGEVKAGIGVDEELHGLAPAAADERGQRVDLGVGLEDIQIPGNGEVTVDVEETAVFDDTKIMQVDPVGATVGIDIGDHVLQQLEVGFVHDPGDGFTQDVVAGVENYPREDEGNDAVQPDQTRDTDDHQTRDDTDGTIRIGLQVAAAGLEGHGIVELPAPDTDGANDKIDEGGHGDDIDALIQLLDGVGMDKIGDRLVDDDHTGHEDQGAFYRGREEFGLAMTVGMVFVAGLGGDVQTVKGDKTGDDVNGALERIGEDRYRLREIVGCQLEEEQENGYACDPSLETDIFLAFFHERIRAAKVLVFRVNRK